MHSNTIGQYTLVKKIGEGARSIVYKATHTAVPEIEVAVKQMRLSLVGDEAGSRAFKSRCLRLSMLHHSNIVRFRDLVVENGRMAMVLELLHGQNLRDALKVRSFAVLETVHVLESVLKALDFAHKQGEVHEDIRPKNVFLCRDGQVKLLSFGDAKGALQTDMRLSSRPQKFREYNAPEYFFEGQGGPQVDVYAVGLIAWEMVTGQMACPDGSQEQKLDWLRRSSPPPAHLVNPSCPQWVSNLIGVFVASELSERPANAGLALDLLRAARLGESGIPSIIPPKVLNGTIELCADVAPSPVDPASVASMQVGLNEREAAKVQLAKKTVGAVFKAPYSQGSVLIVVWLVMFFVGFFLPDMISYKISSRWNRIENMQTMLMVLGVCWVGILHHRRAFERLLWVAGPRWIDRPKGLRWYLFCLILGLWPIAVFKATLVDSEVYWITGFVPLVAGILHGWWMVDLRRNYQLLKANEPIFAEIPQFKFVHCFFSGRNLHRVGRNIVEILETPDDIVLPVPL